MARTGYGEAGRPGGPQVPAMLPPGSGPEDWSARPCRQVVVAAEQRPGERRDQTCVAIAHLAAPPVVVAELDRPSGEPHGVAAARVRGTQLDAAAVRDRGGRPDVRRSEAGERADRA